MPKILIIEDDLDLLDTLSEIFQGEGYQVRSLSHAHNLLFEIHRFEPDIVLMDYWLPGKNGDQALTEIRHSSPDAHLPVVLMSASRSFVQNDSLLGANAFLHKPFDIDDLISTISHSFTAR